MTEIIVGRVDKGHQLANVPYASQSCTVFATHKFDGSFPTSFHMLT